MAKEEQNLARLLSTGQTGNVYENDFSLSIPLPLDRQGLAQVESQLLGDFVLSREWGACLDIEKVRAKPFKSGRLDETRIQIRIGRVPPFSIAEPQILVREYSGPNSESIKLYVILGAAALAGPMEHAELAERDRFVKIMRAASTILFSSPSGAVLSSISAKASSFMLGGVHADLNHLLVREIRELGRGPKPKLRRHS